jgi:hypothetical protein
VRYVVFSIFLRVRHGTVPGIELFGIEMNKYIAVAAMDYRILHMA